MKVTILQDILVIYVKIFKQNPSFQSVPETTRLPVGKYRREMTQQFDDEIEANGNSLKTYSPS
jgi:hypothetical protein